MTQPFNGTIEIADIADSWRSLRRFGNCGRVTLGDGAANPPPDGLHPFRLRRSGNDAVRSDDNFALFRH